MKGKNTFTRDEIHELEELIRQRCVADRSQQKRIRAKMRDLGFYGGDDFGVINMTIEKFHQLIENKVIIVTDNTLDTRKSQKEEVSPKMEDMSKCSQTNTQSELPLHQFKMFDPQKDSETMLPDVPGNFILLLRKDSAIPEIIGTPTFTMITVNNEEYRVLYTGISSDSLRSRDFKNHFHGNAGRSTLRKSIGSLMGFKKIPRDANNPWNGKTKFNENDEMRLTNWMTKNLLLMYLPTTDYETLEIRLIAALNPPLNIKDNHNATNETFRKRLKTLRQRLG